MSHGNEQKDMALSLFAMADQLANRVGAVWDEFYTENEEASKLWLNLEMTVLMTFFRRHVAHAARHLESAPPVAVEELRQFWYAQIKLFSQAGHETVHAGLLNRLDELDAWRLDIATAEDAKVATRDRRFPNEPVSDEAWDLLKRKLQ